MLILVTYKYVCALWVVIDVFTRWKLEKVVPQSIFVESDDVLIPCSDLHLSDFYLRISCRYIVSEGLCRCGMFTGFCCIFS